MLENEIVVEEWSSLQSGVPIVQAIFSGETAEILILLSDEFGEHLLRYVLGHDPKRRMVLSVRISNVGSYARCPGGHLYNCLLVNERSRAHFQEE